MPTEDISAAGEAARLASRRSLIRRLHMPVGKAIALAAMPSAALLGMGFTSPLAKADSQPENPFAGESCVEMPDEPLAEDDAENAENAEDAAVEDDAEDAEEPADGTEEDAAEDAEGSEETDGSASGQPPSDGTAEAPEAPDESADEAPPAGDAPERDEGEEEDEFNPWDPLGLGQGLADLGEDVWDLLTPGEREELAEAQREAEEAEEAERAAAEEAERREAEEREAEEAERAAEEAERQREEEEAARREAEEAERAEREEAEREEAEAAAREEEEAAAREEEDRAADEEAEAGAIPGAGEPFPCPTQERVPGEDEQTAMTLPDESWYLDATYLTLRGLSYHGVVNVTTANGTVKQVLKFTADKLDIGDLHQIVDAQDGIRYHVATAPGSNSTFRDGTVTMYTERLEGNLFGVIPVTFDAEHQPPLDLPIAHFTDVFVTQAGQFGGTLSMEGMHTYTTPDGPTVP